MSQFNLPPITGTDPASISRNLRTWQSVLNEFLRGSQSTGSFFVWNKGCLNVPTNTNEAGAAQIVFESPFTGNGTLIITGVGFEGNVNVSLNGTNLGTLSDPDTSSEILYEVQTSDLKNVEGELNDFRIWSTAGTATELRKLEVWRNFTKGEIDTAGNTADWGSVTGAGKPEDNADVTADHEGDIDVLNTQNAPAESGATKVLGLSGNKATVNSLNDDCVQTDKILDEATTELGSSFTGSSTNISGETDLESVSVTIDTSASIIVDIGAQLFTSSGGSPIIRLYRDSTELLSEQIETPSTGMVYERSFVEAPGAGSYTYKFTGDASGPVGATGENRSINVREYKK